MIFTRVLAFFVAWSALWPGKLRVSDPTIQVNSCHHQSVRCHFQTTCNEQHELLIVVVTGKCLRRPGTEMESDNAAPESLATSPHLSKNFQGALLPVHHRHCCFRGNHHVQRRPEKCFDREGGVLHFSEVADSHSKISSLVTGKLE